MSYYDYALDLILDADSPSTEILTDEQHELVESAAETLYGLIHVRYILTSRGMGAMYEKYKACEFGRCPRMLCNGQPCLPVGTCDVPRQSTVKIFCPKCQETYYPRSKYQVRILLCSGAEVFSPLHDDTDVSTVNQHRSSLWLDGWHHCSCPECPAASLYQSNISCWCTMSGMTEFVRWSAVQGNVDGAFFGTTFPHLLLMTYPGMRPQLPVDRYVPRVFGFKLSAAALAPPAAEPQRNDAAASQASRVKPVLAFRCRALFFKHVDAECRCVWQPVLLR